MDGNMYYSIPGRVSFNPSDKSDDGQAEVHCQECYHLEEKDCREFGCKCCCDFSCQIT